MSLAESLNKVEVKPSLVEWLSELDSESRDALMSHARGRMDSKSLHRVCEAHGCPVKYEQFRRWRETVRDAR